MPGRTLSEAMIAKLGYTDSEFTRGMTGSVRFAKRAGAGISGAMRPAAQAVRGLTRAATAASAAVTGLAVLSVREFVKFETAMVGVAKTVDAPQSEIRALAEDFRALSERIPVSANELLNIAQTAGQLGVPVSQLRKFTEVIAALSVTTNLSSEEAATGLARFANVMQTSLGDIERLGSVVVDLGNKFEVNEREVLEFGTRLAGAGRIAGLTEADVFGLSAALAAVGLEAEAGATAAQKVLIDINTAVAQGNEQLALFAKTAGMGAGAFAKAWTDDAAGAFVRFVEGLGKSGDQATTILQDLELGNERTIRAFVNLGLAGNKLRTALETASVAWQENVALANEAEKFYNRLGARLNSLWNKVTNVAAAFGEQLAPVVDAAAKIAADLLDQLRGFAPEIGRMAQAFAKDFPMIAGTLAGFADIAIGTVRVIKNSVEATIDLLMIVVAEATGELMTFVNLAIKGINLLFAGIDKIPGVNFDFRIAELPADEFLAFASAATKELGQDLKELGDSAKQVGRGIMRFGKPLETKSKPVGTAPASPATATAPDPFAPVMKMQDTMHRTKLYTDRVLVKPLDRSLSLAHQLRMALAGVGDTIANQIAGGVTEMVLGLGKARDIAKEVGKAILREVVGALVKAAALALVIKPLLNAVDKTGGLTKLLGLRDGGIVPQWPHAQAGMLLPATPTPGFGGGIPIMAHPGEAVLTRRAVRNLGTQQIEDMNRGRAETETRAPVIVRIPPPPPARNPIESTRDPDIMSWFFGVLRELEHAGAIQLQRA